VRAIALHPDVLVVTSAVLHVNCVIVRGQVARDIEPAGRGGERDGGGDRDVEGERTGAAGGATAGHGEREGAGSAGHAAETFVIDSPVLPDELDALPALVEQTGFPVPSGLLATHGDWDHVMGRLAFPGVALGCCESTAARLRASPGEAQRDLRAFDEDLMIERQRPLALGSVQALPVPGRCSVGDRELELHRADGHTPDGMAIVIPWARVLLAGDYLSTVELPMLNDGGDPEVYLATLERLRAVVGDLDSVVPGHGPVLDRERAMAVLEEDVVYLRALRERGAEAELPAGRRSKAQRRAHAQNVEAI
jgi:glyoxylase-like metal-dependent hydrolase (beta-lactamase superfamily II)